ncbi:MurR/RpiR family transcriptional regulator [Dickeya dadantii]|uniref:MurR/RpiR family transcriptional regulator n=1 Tax=Dickeya dadantii TaxID=204038 RepID=UPI0021D87BB3|nr:MurR/RpiR family transcriptional regulator [Dickeya dadantii]
MKTTPLTKRKRKQLDIFTERFRAQKDQLSARLFVVAQYIDQNRAAVLNQTAIEIATETDTSDATVIRAIQALGFSGLRDLKNVLRAAVGETLSSPARMATTVSELSPDINASIDFVVDSYRLTCDLLLSQRNRDAIALASSLLAPAERIAIFGIGASALLAEYTSRLFNRYGRSAYVLNRTGAALSEQIIELRSGDVLIMLAQKSAHREGMTTLEEARKLKMKVVLLTGADDSVFIKHADSTIFIPRSSSEEKIPIHGTPIICLEVLVLALATLSPGTPLKTINRLYELNNALTRPKKT